MVPGCNSPDVGPPSGWSGDLRENRTRMAERCVGCTWGIKVAEWVHLIHDYGHRPLNSTKRHGLFLNLHGT